MTQKEYKAFDAATVPLESTNLIEASAGTGKTYSIAILTLRLLLEKAIPIEEILLVTFTKAAVAELVERIRKFVIAAHSIAKGKEEQEGQIAKIVKEATERDGKDEVVRLLQHANLFLDEASIFTIHGFSQKMLGDFAFETGQLFGAEIISDSTPYIEEEVNKFWRKNIAGLPLPLLKMWPNLNRDSFIRIIREHQAGKQYFAYEDKVNYCLDEETVNAAVDTLTQFEEEEKEAKALCLDYISENKENLQSIAASNKTVAKWFPPNWENDEAIFADCWEKKDLSTFAKKFPEFSEVLSDLAEVEKRKVTALSTFYHHIICTTITEVLVGVERAKQLANVMSYDDIIYRLHQVLVIEKNERLIKLMQMKYKAVFIDEFQDTDKLQYEIFNAAFGKASICFFIGDPKQSIFGFRKADVYTYFRAKNNVEHWYSMNYNYRSTDKLITAMNKFFLPTADFDTFHFGGEEESIEYVPVSAPAENADVPQLFLNGAEVSPFSVFVGNNKEDKTEALRLQVLDLLVNENYRLVEKGKERRIKPSDIGILITKNFQAVPIKEALAVHNIQAIVINDSKVTASPEVDDLLAILQAVLQPESGLLHTAMNTALVNVTTNKIPLLDDIALIELFSSYKKLWETEGFYSAMAKFAKDFSLAGGAAKDRERERGISNFNQLVEILHTQQLRNNLGPEQIIKWLKRAQTDDFTEGDEYAQRIESDEEAVKIVTVHKSKGLQYNIVIAPELDMSFIRKKDKTHYYRRVAADGDGTYVTVPGTDAEDFFAEIERQQEQANRRLLYVAITRSVCKCILITTNRSNTTLTQFLTSINEPELIPTEASPVYEPDVVYNAGKKTKDAVYKNINRFTVEDMYWGTSSYSGLSADMPQGQKKFAGAEKNADYDLFIFETLSKGKQAGNFLHAVFEQIDFSTDTHWQEQINRAARQWMPSLQEEEFADSLLQFIQAVVGAIIDARSTSFSLESISQKNRLNELQFDFPIPEVSIKKLEALLQSYSIPAYFKNIPQIQGMMTGSVDMFFKHEEKYYILDWKSTYLGDAIEDYTADRLATAMTEKNYHLQYVIYTIACHLYLQQRLVDYDYERDFGGVVYAYVRGMREERTEGVYFTRLNKELVEELEEMMVATS